MRFNAKWVKIEDSFTLEFHMIQTINNNEWTYLMKFSDGILGKKEPYSKFKNNTTDVTFEYLDDGGLPNGVNYIFDNPLPNHKHHLKITLPEGTVILCSYYWDTTVVTKDNISSSYRSHTPVPYGNLNQPPYEKLLTKDVELLKKLLLSTLKTEQ